MRKHTPGPWLYIPEDGDRDVFKSNGSLLATTYGEFKKNNIHKWTEESEEEAAANAQLIAAAPELLQQLKNCRYYLQGIAGSSAQELLTTVQAAIAKAEGKNA